jgi:iron complex outermembrane recepter protein
MIATYTRSDTNGTVPKMVYYNKYFDGAPGPSNPYYNTVGASGLAAFLGPAIRHQILGEQAAGYGLYDVENNDPNPFVQSTTWQVINTTTWTASDSLTIKNIVSYAEARERYSFSLDGDNVAFPFVITYPGPYRDQGSQSTFTEEFQLQGHAFNNRLTWQGGLYGEISDPIGRQEQWTQVLANCANIYAFQCTTFSPAISSVSIANNDYKYQNYGIYAQGTYKFTDKFGLTLGLRNTWDWEREDGNNVRTVPTATGPLIAAGSSPVCSRSATPAGFTDPVALLSSNACDRAFTTKSSRPTWLIDLDYKPTADMLFFAKYARGYRAGGINEANVGSEVWNPEKVDDYEIGFKTSFRGTVYGAFSIDGFWNEFKDQQTSVTIPQCTPIDNPTCTNPAPTGINGIQNVGSSRMRGVEVDGSIGTGPVRLDVGYAYLDAVVTGGSVPFCDDTRFDCANASFLTAGSRLPFAPKNRVTLTGTFTLPIDPSIGHVSVSATYTHTDTQYSSHSNDLAFEQGAIPYNAGISPATDLLNLNLNWRDVAGTPFDIAVFATNVTNEKYWVSIANGLSTLGGESVIPGEPQMYGVRLKYHFSR